MNDKKIRRNNQYLMSYKWCIMFFIHLCFFHLFTLYLILILFRGKCSSGSKLITPGPSVWAITIFQLLRLQKKINVQACNFYLCMSMSYYSLSLQILYSNPVLLENLTSWNIYKPLSRNKSYMLSFFLVFSWLCEVWTQID